MALLGIRDAAVETRPWWRNPRWAGGALAALVHVALIAFLLSSLPKSYLTLPSPREIFFIFHPAPRPATLPRKIEPRAPVSTAPQLFRYAPQPSGAAIAAPPQTNGLGLSLFGCAPENLAYLSPQQRAQCSGALDTASLGGAVPGAVAEHALQADRWRAAIRQRNTPLAVPCTHTENIIVNGVTGETATAAMADPACVLRSLAGGSAPDK